MREWTITARWVFPVDAPPLHDGVVRILGDRIVGVEPRAGQVADFNVGRAVVVPGFVNAHTHLDLSGLCGQCRPTADFTLWLRAVIEHRRGVSPVATALDIQSGLRQCLDCGVTLLGDISAGGVSWQALHHAPINAVVYYELLGLTESRAAAAWSAATQWLASCPATSTCRPGVSPHAPYSVRSSLFFAAGTLGVPVTVHLAESAAETTLLTQRGGAFEPFLKELGVWDADGLANDAAHVLRLVSGLSPTALAHGTYLDADAPIPKNATIVYCPRTHAAFGHAPHPFRELLARGVSVALGTDSLASNPDLDILAEARFVQHCCPDVPAATLLRMITLNGARALGWQDSAGSLTPGKLADLVVLPLSENCCDDPHTLLFQGDAPVSAVLWRGVWRDPPGVPKGLQA